MTELFQDSGFLGAVVGAISGLVGAAIGGAATYYAALRQSRIEHHTKQNSALAASLIEIYRNRSILERELDGVLPLWLTRCYSDPRLADTLRYVTSPIPRYATQVYEAFFTELIPSPYGSELKSYYDRISFINKLSEAHFSGLPSRDFETYVSRLALALELTYSLVDELQSRVSKTMPKNWGKDNNYGEAVHQRQRCLYMVALHRIKLSELESFLEGQKSEVPLPRIIIETGKGPLYSYVEAARRLLGRSSTSDEI